MSYYLNAMRNYATFAGRASRTEFWMFGLILLVILFVAATIDLSISPNEEEAGVLTAIVMLVHFIPSCALMGRRLHDAGETAWLVLACFIPIVALIFALLPSTPGDNCYGPHPSTRKEVKERDMIGDIANLEKAAALKQAGALTDEEFSKMKKKLLNA